jgi:hypothetical protein
MAADVNYAQRRERLVLQGLPRLYVPLRSVYIEGIDTPRISRFHHDDRLKPIQYRDVNSQKVANSPFSNLK